jgi:hypothetical protein
MLHNNLLKRKEKPTTNNTEAPSVGSQGMSPTAKKLNECYA